MRAAAILGPGNIARAVDSFKSQTGAEWTSQIDQADVVVIFGGDGTVHHHLSTLVDADVRLLVVPCGSGNDFARSLKIRSLRDAVEAWRGFASGTGNVRRIDLGVIRELPRGPVPALRDTEKEAGEAPVPHRYFCCVAGVGLDSEIAKQANALPRWIRAHGGYALSAPREFLRFAPFPMKVSCNETAAVFRPTMLAAVANTPTYGGGMKIAPQAKLDDGKLDVCIVLAMNAFKLFCLFPTVYLGRHLSFKEVEYQRTQCVRIETEFPFDVYADGEYVCRTPVEFDILPKALKVLVS